MMANCEEVSDHVIMSNFFSLVNSKPSSHQRSHLEPLRLMELDSGLVLTKEPGEVTRLDLPLLVENLLLSVDAADNVDIPAVLEAPRAEAVQVILAEERAAVGHRAAVSPLEVEDLLLPVVPEEHLWLQRLHEAPEQAGGTVETQRGWSFIHPLLFRRQLLIFTTSRPLRAL